AQSMVSKIGVLHSAQAPTHPKLAPGRPLPQPTLSSISTHTHNAQAPKTGAWAPMHLTYSLLHQHSLSPITPPRRHTHPD
ncbi:hypothetical protein PIB30_078303, partial [Stylosanthes scabra]|nr:hypothetical protein [Stylosanthes scabra]